MTKQLIFKTIFLYSNDGCSTISYYFKWVQKFQEICPMKSSKSGGEQRTVPTPAKAAHV
jgi:hypothetical protein